MLYCLFQFLYCSVFNQLWHDFFLSLGYPQQNGVHLSRVKSYNGKESNSPRIMRARSKSAVTLSRCVVKVNEIVPAVPPRRASLGILNRTNSSLNKSAGKCGLKALKESGSSGSVCQSDTSNGLDNSLSKSEENLDERTYMVLEREPDHEYALPNKPKFFASAEKENESEPAVRMTMRERLKQLTQSSEEEIDQASDSDLSPAVDRPKSDLVNDMMNSVKENKLTNVGQPHVVTLKFSADNGMLSAEGAHVTTAGQVSGDTESPKKADKDTTKEPRFKIKPGTDAQGYTKLLHVDDRHDDDDDDTKVSKSAKTAPVSSFISYLPLDSSCTTLDSDSGVSSAPTPVRGSWVSRMYG